MRWAGRRSADSGSHRGSRSALSQQWRSGATELRSWRRHFLSLLAGSVVCMKTVVGMTEETRSTLRGREFCVRTFQLLLDDRTALVLNLVSRAFFEVSGPRLLTARRCELTCSSWLEQKLALVSSVCVQISTRPHPSAAGLGRSHI